MKEATGQRLSMLVAPEPCDVRWVRGRFPTPHGEVSVRWQRDDNKFTLWVVLPDAVSGEAVLPSFVPEGAEVKVQLTIGSVTRSQWRDGRWHIKLSAGTQGKVEANW